ncbi:MAG: M66 family metalloprotease [Polyangiaceae bacterium]
METTTSEPPVMATYQDVQGVTISQIALYQGVKRPIMENGQASSSTVPIVANREGTLRVFMATDAGFDGQPVVARLFLNGSETAIEQTVSINGNPQEATLGSTLNLKLAGTDIPVGFSFRLELSRLTTEMLPANPGARWPASGFAQTGAKSAGNQLKITLVPIAYGADGSNRLPDTSAAQIEAYRKLFYGMYPVPEVQITVREPVQWNNTVSAGGSGWDSLLSSIGSLRSNDKAAFDVYYYGIFSPASSAQAYCSGGCVAGLGNIGGVNDAYSRAAIGLGFPGDIATETAVHEIGHTHGRYHAPCGGAQGTDPNFPYSGAKIGAWGFDINSQKLYSPSSTVDLLSAVLATDLGERLHVRRSSTASRR